MKTEQLFDQLATPVRREAMQELRRRGFEWWQIQTEAKRLMKTKSNTEMRDDDGVKISGSAETVWIEVHPADLARSETSAPLEKSSGVFFLA